MSRIEEGNKDLSLSVTTGLAEGQSWIDTTACSTVETPSESITGVRRLVDGETVEGQDVTLQQGGILGRKAGWARVG